MAAKLTLELYDDGTEKLGEEDYGQGKRPALPLSMDLFVNQTGRAYVRFLLEKDRRRFPLDNPIIRDELREMLGRYYHKEPDTKQWNSYIARCRAKALREARVNYDPEEAAEEETVVRAVRAWMVWWHREYKKVWRGTLTKLRKLLIWTAEVNDIDSDGWHKGHQFSRYLKERLGELAEGNIRLKFEERTGMVRLITVSWIKKNAIPTWSVRMTKMTKGDAIKDLFSSQEEEVDLFEELAKEAPKRTTERVKKEEQPAEIVVVQEEAQPAKTEG